MAIGGTNAKHDFQTGANKRNGTPSSYSKWLGEDVIYIIDDAEPAAFLQLTTDEERNDFIVHFSERRNTPSRCMRRNSAIVLWSGASRPSNHINSMFRRHSDSSRREERICCK